MKIILITPAQLGKQTGNNITATRWANILMGLGHSVSIKQEYQSGTFDMMIALNGYRSKYSIQNFKSENPNTPLVIALTGTDLYRFLETHTAETLASIRLADKLVVLGEMAVNRLPVDLRSKAFLIYESAEPLPNGRQPLTRFFDICIIGHLRAEKDPLLTALASRSLPSTSKIRIRHYGKAHTEEWADKARKEMGVNPRYTWFGEVPHWKVRWALGKCNLMVLSSVMEGGPNSLSEAIVAGVPILTTQIDGCVGVLGKEYNGYFPVGDKDALQKLLRRAEMDPKFLISLENFVVAIAPRFSYQEEETCWANLLSELNNYRKRRSA